MEKHAKEGRWNSVKSKLTDCISSLLAILLPNFYLPQLRAQSARLLSFWSDKKLKKYPDSWFVSIQPKQRFVTSNQNWFLIAQMPNLSFCSCNKICPSSQEGQNIPGLTRLIWIKSCQKSFRRAGRMTGNQVNSPICGLVWSRSQRKYYRFYLAILASCEIARN